MPIFRNENTTRHYYIASKLACSLHDAAERHYAALKRLSRYLAGHRDASVFFKTNASAKLLFYEDSDYPGCKDTRRSRTVIAVHYTNDLLYWRSVLLNFVTLSSSEA